MDQFSKQFGTYRRALAATLLVTALLVGSGAAYSSGTTTTAASSEANLPREVAGAPSAAGDLVREEQARGSAPLAPASPPGAPAVPQPAAAPGGDVIVNNPAADTPERTTQSETSLSVRGNTLCAGFNDSGPRPAGSFSGVARSANLGQTWTDQGELTGGADNRGDPALAVNETTGTFYYAEIATIGGNAAIGVARSTNDCVSFAAPVNASPVGQGPPATVFNDKPWVDVDNSGGPNNGNVYVCWTRFFNSFANSELRFSRSTDGGLTYTNEQVLQASFASETFPFGCDVHVGPTGQVYVMWADRFGATANDIRFRSSTNGGLTFTSAVSVSTGNRAPGTDNVVNCGPGNNRTALNGDIRMLHQAWMAVDTTGGPFNGNIYAVWATDPPSAPGTADHSDVFFTRSTNGGVTWDPPTRVGGGSGLTDQFEPNVAVGGNGTVSIAWYDRRLDPNQNLNIDVFKTFSRDGGATLDPISRVTDVSFGVPPINPNFDPGVARCYMGEYIAIEGDAQNFYYAWGDNRNILVTTNYPNGRPDPNVFFEFEPVQTAASKLSIGNGKVYEGDAGRRIVRFPVTLSSSSASPVTVDYRTVNGVDGVAPADYTAKTGTLTFPAGVTSQQVSVSVNGNTINEGTEFFKVRLSNPQGATLSDDSGTAVIIGDDPGPAAPHLTVGSASVYEGEDGSSVHVMVTLSKVSASPVSVSFATASGSAAAPADYTATSGNLTFAPGQRTKAVTVPIAGDTTAESTETFTVQLSAASGAPIRNGTGTVKILNGI